MRRLAAAAAVFLLAGEAFAAAPALSALEHHLEAYLQGASGALREGAACLQQDQKRWRAELARRCSDDTCRGSAYLDRLAELHALQPGVTAIRYFELPRRAELVWIVPPAADKVAAPDNRRAIAAQLEGAVLDEVATGDGFVLRTPAGERYLLVMLMFLEGTTAQRLSFMAAESQRGASFVARGHLVNARARSFEPSRCLFLHRRTP